MLTHQPQEIEVWYVIPSIRREYAIQLKEKGISQVEISRILGVTKSAVNQYLKEKRAKKIDFPSKIVSMIKESSEKIRNNPKILTNEIQGIIQEIRNSGLLCEYHRKYCDINEECTVCVG